MCFITSCFPWANFSLAIISNTVDSDIPYSFARLLACREKLTFTNIAPFDLLDNSKKIYGIKTYLNDRCVLLVIKYHNLKSLSTILWSRSQVRQSNKNLSDRIHRIWRINCIRPLRKSGLIHASASRRLVSAADYFVGYVFFLHRIALLAAGDGLLPVRLPAGRQHPAHPVNPV